jgi:hypothetical protein
MKKRLEGGMNIHLQRRLGTRKLPKCHCTRKMFDLIVLGFVERTGFNIIYSLILSVVVFFLFKFIILICMS